MDQNPISEYWIDDVSIGSDGELRYALENFCDDIPITNGVEYKEPYGDGCSVDQASIKKRGREEKCTETKSKACREKMRRDRLNDRFAQLSSVLEPGRPPRSDKVSILSDATHLLKQLKTEAEQLKDSNEKLHETIKELKAEKNELRDEKAKMKAEKERLEQQVKAMTQAPQPFMPHPMAIHPAFAMQAQVQAQATASQKGGGGPSISAYPNIAMWQWLPPSVIDTSHDSKLWSPNA